MPFPESKDNYTYADDLTWPEGERWEIIDQITVSIFPDLAIDLKPVFTGI